MEAAILIEFSIIVALILVNGIFSGAEIAIVSLRRTRLQQLVDEKRAGAVALSELRSEPERFLATVQVGITVVGTTAAAFGGAATARHLEPLIAGLPMVGPAVVSNAREISLVLVVAMVSYLSLVLGELVPKSLALKVGEIYALLLARPLLWLAIAARPIIWLLTASSNVLLAPFRDRTNFMEAQVSTEELQQMVDEAGEAGTLHEHTSEIASRAIAFDKLTLREVMIPRDQIDALPKNASMAAIKQFLLDQRRSRIPVYEGSLDNVIGYVSAKDIVSVAWDHRQVVLQEVLRELKVFPETILAVEVLRFMRRERHRVVIAVDEHGVVAGLATFEDLVEELVGDVFSEDEDDRQPISLQIDGTAIVRGEVPLRDVNRDLGLALVEADGATTVAGLCARLAGGIPNRNARLAAEDGTVLVVLDANPRSVRRVRVMPPPQVDDDDDKKVGRESSES